MKQLCALVVVIACLSGVRGETQDPSTLPLVQQADLSYVGGFRLPQDGAFDFGGAGLAFNPSGSLFVSSKNARVAEITIPTPVNASQASAMPVAAYLQQLADPTEGRGGETSTTANPADLNRLLVIVNRLCVTYRIYYDAGPPFQTKSHGCRSLSLSTPSFNGWSTIGDAGRTGFVSGWMALIPAEWQAKLGGAVLTGQCCIPIASRTSWGPSAFAFDGSKIGQATVPAAALLYYDGVHPTLGLWDGATPSYGISTEIGGPVIVPGTRTVLYFGRNGLGPACYGTGTANQALHGIEVGDGSKYCYDPTDGSKGTHSFPYGYQAWAYDLNEFAAVNAGLKKPWEVKPYGLWPLKLPIANAAFRMGGVTIDMTSKRVYLAQSFGDIASRPVIHAIDIKTGGNVPAPTPTPVPVPTPTPVPVPMPTPTPPATLKPNYEAFTVANVVFRIPERMFTNATHCLVNTERASVRILIGSTPTATTGRPLPTSYERFFTIDEAREARIIAATSTTAKVHVECPVKQ